MSRKYLHLIWLIILVAAWLLDASLRPERDALLADPFSIILAIAVSTALSVGSGYIAYRLQPKPATVERGKQDVRIQTSRYGEPIPRGYGKFATAASVIYRSAVTTNTTRIPGQRSKRGNTPDQISYTYSVTVGWLVCSAKRPVRGVTLIRFDDKVVYTGIADGNEVDTVIAGTNGLNIKLGGEAQLPNTWYEADKGVGNVSAHRGQVTVWAKDLNVTDFFNRLPNALFEVEMEDGTVEEIVAAECALVSLDSSKLNISTLTDVCDGILISNVAAPRQAIEYLQQWFQFVMPEVDGKLKGVKLPQSSSFTVPLSDLRAVDGGIEDQQGEEEPAPATQISHRQTLEVPRTVTVSYFEAARGYEQGTQSFTRQIYDSQAVATLNFPIVATPAEANRVARVLAVTGWAERRPITFTLPPRYIKYHPGDVLTIPTVDGTSHSVRILSMDFAPANRIEIQGVIQVAEAYSQVGVGSTSRHGIPDFTPVQIPETDVWFGEIPPYIDAHADGRAFTYTAASPKPAPGVSLSAWKGAPLYRNLTGTDEATPDYEPITSFPVAATMGYTLTSLGAGAVWDGSNPDTTNTLRIQLNTGSLETIPQLSFDNTETANLLAVGSEIIQFRDAVVVDAATRTYDIDHLKRGLRGTSVAAHVANEKAVLLNDAVQRVFINENEIGTNNNYVAPTLGQPFDDAVRVPYTYDTY